MHALHGLLISRRLCTDVAARGSPFASLAAVLRQGLELVAVGLAVGMAGAAVLTRVTESLLYGVKPGDLVTYGEVAIVLTATGALACYVPALRATRIDPAVALRSE